MKRKNRRGAYSHRARRTLLVMLLILAAGMTIGTMMAEQARPTGAKSVVPFIENNYAQALAEARERNVLLFVDAWASW